MPVSASAFKDWLEGCGLTTSPSQLSRISGFHRVTLTNQMKRGNVPESVVVAIARASNMDPVRGLAAFAGYEDIDTRPRQPTAMELLSQVHHLDLMAELQHRSSQKKFPRALRKEFTLIDFPYDGSHRSWIDAIDTGEVRHQIAELTSTSVTYVYAQLTDNKLGPVQAVTAGRITGGSMTSGLVVTGLLTPLEGGWPIRAREDALLEVSDDDLIELIRQRIQILQRRQRQRKEALDYAEKLTELLG